ncbi:MAG: hypothetical protein KGH49_04065, partial [Candidatus Micrarchaeota archaeon]|nr:hypothetical protein [Candidatus Micrarchaeota archaeon]
MRKLALSLTFLVFLFLSAASYATSTIGSASISALAVTGLGNGNVTPISINVTQGSGGVSILGPTTITNDTIQSAKQAASDASAYLGLKESNYNFTYFINYSSISGPSGGLALSLLAVSALTHTPLLTDFAVTGTIGTDGTVGEIGGIDEKASAAKAAGKSFVIVPMAANGTFENQLYYIVQQSLGLPLVQASSLAQALPYAYGTASPKPMSYNVLANYHLSQVQNFTPSCAGCNLSEFANLAYSTVNLTRKEANLIRGNYTTLKGQYLAMSNNYSTVISKG